MRLSHAVSLLPLAAFVGALNVTSPTKGEDVDLSKSFTVTWTSVDTDPTSFNIYLVNNAIYPSVDTKLASDVETSKGSYTISSVSGVTDGDGYQINLMSDSTQNTGILAQSNQFTVDGSASSSSSSTLSTSASSTGTSSSTSSSTGTSTASTTSTGTASSSSSSSSQGSTTTSSNTTTSSGSSTSGVSTTVTGANTLSTAVSSHASSTAGTSANGTSTTAPTSTGAAVALTAPVSAAAGLMMMLAFTL